MNSGNLPGSIMGPNSDRPWIIGITGASGICYARRLVELVLTESPTATLEIVASESALRVMREEEGVPWGVVLAPGRG